MPSRERRREVDGRSERFESEIRQSEMMAPDFAAKRKFMCSRCHFMFEERSRNCPRCDSRTMGELKPLVATESEMSRAIERAKSGRGARLPGEGI